MQWNKNGSDIPQFENEEESAIFEGQVLKMFSIQFASLVGSTLAMVPDDRRASLLLAIQDRTSCYAPFTADVYKAILEEIDK